jgi:hypothetical protein
MANSTLWVAATQPVPGKESEYNEWYDEHITKMFESKYIKKVGRYRNIQQMGKNEEDCSPYLVFYEFNNDADLDSFLKSPEMEAAVKESEAEGKSLINHLWSARYQLMKSLEREKTVEPVVWAVGITCNPNDEEGVTEWYHWKMDTLFKFKDLRGTRRYRFDKNMGPSSDRLESKYISMYELDNQEALAPFQKCPEYAEMGVPYREKWKDNKDFKIVWSGMYDPIKVLKRE